MKQTILNTMKLTTAFVAVASVILSQNSFAKETTVEKNTFKNLACELPFDLDGVQKLRSFAVETTTTLSPLQIAQVKATAERWAVQMDYDEYPSFEQSILVMKNDSEGEELNYSVFRYKGEVFTQVVLYPGGNAFGVIFQGHKLLAEQHDGDIICEKSLRTTL
jgi:hypothetical protein